MKVSVILSCTVLFLQETEDTACPPSGYEADPPSSPSPPPCLPHLPPSQPAGHWPVNYWSIRRVPAPTYSHHLFSTGKPKHKSGNLILPQKKLFQSQGDVPVLWNVNCSFSPFPNNRRQSLSARLSLRNKLRLTVCGSNDLATAFLGKYSFETKMSETLFSETKLSFKDCHIWT